ncbi:MAG: hypothetical protein LQ338_004202 [Usnochroma carphineum]|nr:MAG: hypothetical protein LQ338_004202 [Usnochroma carphineum]
MAAAVREKTRLQNESDLESYGSSSESDLERAQYARRKTSTRFHRAKAPSAYSSSSRETSGSHQHLLKTSSNRRKSRFYFYRIPQKVVKYMCWALLSTIVIFVLCLIRASYTSSRQVEMGTVEKSPPKPPPWEAFPFLKRYHGGIRSLVPKKENVPEYPHDPEERPGLVKNTSNSARNAKPLPKSVSFDPYPKVEEGYAGKLECFLDSKDTVRIPKVHYYEGVMKGLPDAIMGSHEVLGLRDDICFERFGRLGPYGYGYSLKRGGTGAGLHGDREGAEELWTESDGISEVDYSAIKWAKVQASCAKKNAARFTPTEQAGEDTFLGLNTDQEGALPGGNADDKSTDTEIDRTVGKRDTQHTPAAANQSAANPGSANKNVTLLPRTALLIRTWWDFQYSTEDIIYLRSLITELSLLSGGEFIIHFLIHVRDDNVPIWADRKIYDRVLENALPAEFRGMGTLWSERQMGLIYGGIQESFFRDLPVHGVYRSTFMPVQYFSHLHPEYDFIWNWEMDVRYTGQWYHFFDRIRKWTKAQPRKGLWERNGRFYIPSVHGSWEDFKQMVRVQTEMGTDSPNNIWSGLKAPTGNPIPGANPTQPKADTPVWGPEPPPDVLTDQDDPRPPTTHEKDRYEWGVGEEADLITFNPLFDPDGTTWFFTEDITGYNTTASLPPRRAAITTTSRLSRRLLTLMHHETVLKRHTMFSEMWPASVSLHHGLKAVYAPHPMYIDRDWPPSYLAAVMNAGRNGASGGARTSVYGGREHNFKGTTWFYDAGFAPNLWRRWLGLKVDNDGGEREEVAGEGRMCLPGVLLHPVKGVELVVEGGKMVGEDGDGGESEGSGKEGEEDTV